MRRHYVTIKDIARALDISVSTVSRALRDTYDVNPETREKILKKAAELNYKPNFNATGLVQSSTHNIGIILPEISNYYFSTVIAGIQEVAYRYGYNIILYVTNDSAEWELNIVRNLTCSSLDGLLVSVSSQQNACEHFQDILDGGLPLVFFDRVASNMAASKVMQDDYNGAFEGTEHLILNGYRKIAHITGPAGMVFTEKRKKGYADALEKYQIPLQEEWIVHSGFSQEDGVRDMTQLLALSGKPDAVFAVNDRKAVGAMTTLKSRGIRIGKDTGVVGFTNDPVSAIISPTLTTVAEPALDIGKKSCELLMNHIKKSQFPPQEIILPAKLLARESTVR